MFNKGYSVQVQANQMYLNKLHDLLVLGLEKHFRLIL